MEVAGTKMQSFAIDHHGIVAAVCRDLGLQEKIDKRIHSNDPRRVVGPGQAVIAMILNGLGFSNRRLYLTRQFFENKPVDRLLRSDLEAKHLDDHTLGKALDEIAEYGVSKFFGEIAFSIALEQNLLGKTVHNDTTSISVSGEYEDGTGLINVTYGYSKDHRQDLKQVIMNLVTTGSAGIPLWMQPRNGNDSDAKSLQDTVERVRNFQKEFKVEEEFRWVMDSAWYSEENIARAGNNVWISRAPERIREAKRLTEASDDTFIWEPLEDGYKICSHFSQYGGILQRWILVFSEQAYARERKTFSKRLSEKRDVLRKKIWHLGNEVFKCEGDAAKALKELQDKEDYFLVSGEIKEIKKHSGRGRPSLTVEPRVIGYKIEAGFEDNISAIDKKLNTKGRFILATNDMDSVGFTDAMVLQEYKEQQQVERGFRFLKDPWFMVDSIFLKSTDRIAALMAVMGLCLMIYNIAQHRLRESLSRNNETIPNQLNKPIQNPTLRWIFQIMEGISIVRFYDEVNELIREVITNLNHLRKKIITLFGQTAKLIYGIA